MFCSDECQSKVYQSSFSDPLNMFIPFGGVVSSDITMAFFMRFFKNLGDLDRFGSRFEQKNFTKSIFDFDLSDPSDKNYKKNLLLCFLGLQPSPEELETDDWDEITKLLHHFRLVKGNNCDALCYSTNGDKHGTVIFLFGCLMNHSCVHNIGVFHLDKKSAFVVLQPIKANEQLFLNYGLV
jgi:hypothetical protein